MAELRTLSINELKVGMFVKDIILKNSAHKVKNQGVVNSERTIALLKKQGVDKVIVELQPEQLEQLSLQSNVDNVNDHLNDNLHGNINDDNHSLSDENQDDEQEPKHEQQHKQDQEQSLAQVDLDDELAKAFDIYLEASERVKSLYLQVRKGQKISTDGIEELALEIMHSVIRNEYAIAILTRIRHHSTYQWEHAINCAIHMCGFALFAGLKPDTVHQITIGALLHDIGNAKVPEGIIAKPDSLTINETTVIKGHAIHGVSICKQEGLINPIIIDLTMNHHERLDGSGYPRGLSEDKLSKLTRMMTVVDVYDAITADRNYKKAQQPIEVFRYLITNKTKFDPNIVQQFIKYLGVHPVGSVVQLSNDRLAMVMIGNRKEPLKPKVKIFFNLETMQYIKTKDVDLSTEPLTIVSAVNTDDFDINSQRVIKDFISAP